jgi:hypothetical protein
MRALVEALRTWNQGRGTADQIGFYGFEIPSALHAVSVVTSLPDSITGPPLKAWLARTYGCVGLNEGAHFGLEGRVADSSYWSACGPATTAGLDSIVALRRRVSASSRAAADVAFAEQMARLVQHHVRIGLRHLKREEFNASTSSSPTRWGQTQLAVGRRRGAGRLILNRTTMQTRSSSPIDWASYRAVAFALERGLLRSAGRRRPSGGEPSPICGDPPLRHLRGCFQPRAEGRLLARHARCRRTGRTWLRGPHQMRLIRVVHGVSPEASETPVEFPKFFDAVVFVRHVTAARRWAVRRLAF